NEPTLVTEELIVLCGTLCFFSFLAAYGLIIDRFRSNLDRLVNHVELGLSGIAKNANRRAWKLAVLGSAENLLSVWDQAGSIMVRPECRRAVLSRAAAFFRRR